MVGKAPGCKLLTLAALSSLLFYKKREGKGIAQNAGLVPRTRVLWKAKTAGQADSGLVQRRCAQARGPSRRGRAPTPLKPRLSSGGSTECPGLGVRELAQLARFITRA